MLKANKKFKSQSGFTIIELLIATAVFSLVLLVVTSGIIRMGQAYYKGITMSRVQEATRTVSQEVSSSIQLAAGKKRNGSVAIPNAQQFCIGDVRYTYFINQMVDDSNSGLLAEKITPSTSCPDPTPDEDPPENNAKEMLGEKMRLLRFDVDGTDASERVWNINIRIAYGDNDLLNHYTDDGTPVGWAAGNPYVPAVQDANCKSGIAGSSFCAVSQLDTIVKKRLNIP